jgi:hypothetical protein
MAKIKSIFKNSHIFYQMGPTGLVQRLIPSVALRHKMERGRLLIILKNCA